MSEKRVATINRITKETEVSLELCLDGGVAKIDTGVGFFDHMLDHLAAHGDLGLSIKAHGDIQVDDHHTVEDVGIVLGKALSAALDDKRGIERYGFASVPMDEALARVSVDLSGRPVLVFDAPPLEPGAGPDKVGSFDLQLVPEFLRALSSNGLFTLHVETPRGENRHHIVEAIFKALGRALRQAVAITGEAVPSTKGVL